MYSTLKNKCIFESCYRCPFSFSSKVCNLPFCHCRFREDPLVPRGVWRICQLKDSKAGDLGPMVMHLMWSNFRQFNSSKEAHRGKTCYSTATYMLHMSETFQDKSFYENAHEISAQCCRLSVLVLKENTRFWRKPFELTIDCNCLLNFTGNPVQLSHQELDDFLAVNTYKDQTVGRWMCGICGLSFLNKIDVNRHIESKHVILPELLCAICNKPSKTRHSLRIHMKNTHPEAFAEK